MRTWTCPRRASRRSCAAPATSSSGRSKSATTRRPPGRSTAAIAARPPSGSEKWCTAKRQVTASNVPSRKGEPHGVRRHQRRAPARPVQRPAPCPVPPAGLGQHLRGEVHPGRQARRPHPLRQGEEHQPGAGGDVQHALPRPQRRQLQHQLQGGVATPAVVRRPGREVGLRRRVCVTRCHARLTPLVHVVVSLTGPVIARRAPAAATGSTGKAPFQALKPPRKAAASQPLARSCRAARALVASLGQVQ